MTYTGPESSPGVALQTRRDGFCRPPPGLFGQRDAKLNGRAEEFASAQVVPGVLELKLVRKPGFAPGPSRSQAEMLLLHHDPDLNGAPGRTRTDEYEFTKLALWLLRHRGWKVQSEEFRLNSAFCIHSSFKIGALTWICTTNFRLRRAACRSGYTLRANWRPWSDSHRLGPA